MAIIYEFFVFSHFSSVGLEVVETLQLRLLFGKRRWDFPLC